MNRKRVRGAKGPRGQGNCQTDQPKASRRGNVFFLLAFTLLYFFPLPLQGMEITPFQTQNQSPLVQIFGLPAPDEATILSSGKTAARFVTDIANNYATDSTSRENILLDGESYRFTLEGRYGIGHGVELGLEIPYVVYGGGFLDGTIDAWHKAFGFPEGGRNLAPRNRLLITYQRNQRDRLRIDQSNSGLGDIRFKGGLRLFEDRENGTTALALRAGLKAPTGDPDFLHGSGSTDLALWLIGSHDIPWVYGHWSFWGSAGFLAMTTGQVLSDQQRNGVGFGSLGVGYRPLSWIAFKVQANGHTPFYKDSDLRELSMGSVQLLVGGSLYFSDRICLDLGVAEDMVVKTSPDVVFHFAFTKKF